jgi:putative transposase
MRYAWIERHSRQWPVSLLCQTLGVSPSGYHARKARDVDTDRPRRRISNDTLLVHIKAVHAESKGEYGWPRVWKQLLAQGVRVSKDRVPQLMKLHGIRAKTKRRFQRDHRQQPRPAGRAKPAATRLLARSPRSGLEHGHHLPLD